MKAFSFNVTIAASALDTEVVEDTIKQALVDGLPEETLSMFKSHQGIFRARLEGGTKP